MLYANLCSLAFEAFVQGAWVHGLGKVLGRSFGVLDPLLSGLVKVKEEGVSGGRETEGTQNLKTK